ncbi:MAG: RNA-binding S4 domain-containing protein [Eubacteriales bacterium]|nr:RNA-binding S4 domain-containing protein [Eubacteriales bacterium]
MGNTENIIEIRDEYIRLGQALKLAGIAQTGIEAKIMITSGEVLVNGETEERRGRKLRDGDRVEGAARQWRFSVKAGRASE